jgi:short-subunit dehydrogenase
MDTPRSLAVITGASSGIGYELAKQCAENGFDLVVVADEPALEGAAYTLRQYGVGVDSLRLDLSTGHGTGQLITTLRRLNRPIDVLVANAGLRLGKGFLDQGTSQIMKAVHTNISATLHLLHEIGRDMRSRGRGRILITGSIAGWMPGTFQAVYNGTKAFLDSFSIALRHELRGTGISVTCLLPGAAETKFFERAGMMDTKVGDKDSPAAVALTGFTAMMNAKESVMRRLRNKLRALLASVTPQGMLAEMHRRQASR